MADQRAQGGLTLRKRPSGPTTAVATAAARMLQTRSSSSPARPPSPPAGAGPGAERPARTPAQGGHQRVGVALLVEAGMGATVQGLAGQLGAGEGGQGDHPDRRGAPAQLGDQVGALDPAATSRSRAAVSPPPGRAGSRRRGRRHRDPAAAPVAGHGHLARGVTVEDAGDALGGRLALRLAVGDQAARWPKRERPTSRTASGSTSTSASTSSSTPARCWRWPSTARPPAGPRPARSAPLPRPRRLGRRRAHLPQPPGPRRRRRPLDGRARHRGHPPGRLSRGRPGRPMIRRLVASAAGVGRA